MNIDRGGRLNLADVKFVDPGMNARRLAAGDVLFNNTNSPALIGKTCAISSTSELAFSNHMTRLRPVDGVEAGFLAHQLHYLWMRGFFLHRCKKHVNQASVSSHELAATVPAVLAPWAEQRRIVAAIDSCFTRLDDAVATLRRVQTNLQRYRASVLKAAVEGRLVPTEAELARPNGRDYEPAQALIERIEAARRRGREGQNVRPKSIRVRPSTNDEGGGAHSQPPTASAHEMPRLPEGWCWATVGSLFEVHIGATPARDVPEYWNGGVPWVSSGEVSFCRIRSTRETISRAGLANASTQLNPPGTVMIGMIGEGKTRGQVALLEIEACNNQNAAAIWVSQTPILPEYIYFVLMEQYEETRKRSSGNNQPALNKARVGGIPIPLPPVSEQRRIVSVVDLHLSLIDYLQREVANDLEACLRLSQAVLGKAFTGALVDQDPNDEPAAALLGRIRSATVQERSARQGSTRGRFSHE
jgi:type I restriction enzyme S subunit